MGAAEGPPWVSSPGRCTLNKEGVRGSEDEGGDGVEKVETGGDGKLSEPLDDSLAGGLTASSAAVLARWRL